MKNNSIFEVERAGINTTFQDLGFSNMQHLGIPTGGVMDVRLFKIANKLLGNDINEGSIEFTYQGPRLKLISGKTNFAISGNIHFTIERINKNLNNENYYPYQTYQLQEGDILDITATKKSLYGYLSVEGGFKLKKFNNSVSTLLKASIGSNNGEKISENQKILLNKTTTKNIKNKINLNLEFNNIVRVIAGPQINFFPKNSLSKFFMKPYIITNNLDRMGIRLNGNKILNAISNNIPSEGILKGSIQIPEDGNPIILMADYPTIGGYPKIATIISADFSKVVQTTPGKNIYFKLISLKEAELAFQQNEKDLNKYYENIQKYK